ncbi:hypothetical protein CGLO_15015 [Colletotrichum gloeosporioides Cg-14]|uniref:Uncharacterized protein n=1 Tax=Colletotrichum gloeosporioides (strain Cg-14) TaxID=1237896 RepID=T0L310_COLGC|nr:hypothetical protein CGLO_15015 [Colletotrichum gloeosporioides Cg-14]
MSICCLWSPEIQLMDGKVDEVEEGSAGDTGESVQIGASIEPLSLSDSSLEGGEGNERPFEPMAERDKTEDAVADDSE